MKAAGATPYSVETLRRIDSPADLIARWRPLPQSAQLFPQSAVWTVVAAQSLYAHDSLRFIQLSQHGEVVGLAPMAVRAAWQRRGLGSALIAEGTKRLREAGAPFVFVIGHPEYYPRFGFERASRHGVRCQWPEVPDEAVMLLVLDSATAPRLGGVARYRPEFDAVV